ncbi:MAG: YdjY domain-containing protein [Planctomycetota bacterium]
MRRIGVCVLALAAACAAGSALAGQQDRQRLRLAEALRRGRSGVVLLRTATGVCSGTLLGRGFVAASKDRLRAAGRITVFAFRLRKTEDGREVLDRVEVGEAEVVRLHRSADAALLTITDGRDPPAFEPLPHVPDFPPPGSEVNVCGVLGAVRFEDALDLDARGGEVLKGPASAQDVVPIAAPVHVNSAGGAVLDAEGRLVAVASCRPPQGAPGGAVPIARFEELVSGSQHALPSAEAAEHLAPKPGPPPHLALPPGGGLEGKRVSLGHGAFAIKESRAVIASAVVILDQHDALEYAVCPVKKGKLHETVIASDANPTTLNFALVMLGYKSGGGVEQLGDAKTPLGERVRLFVEWDWNEAAAIREHLAEIDPPWERPRWKEVLERVREGTIRWEPGPRARARAEDFIFDRVEGRPMRHTNWVYTGGRFGRDEETGKRYYEATENGVFAAVYRDPSAVLNNPLKGGEDDTYYCVDDTVVPPRGTRCTLIILPAEPEDGPAE